MKRFADLSEQEVLALAISNEEEDSRIYRDFAEGLRADFPDTAKMFDAMAAEEVGTAACFTISIAPSSGSICRCCGGRTCAASCATSRCGWCGRSASTRCATTPPPRNMRPP